LHSFWTEANGDHASLLFIVFEDSFSTKVCRNNGFGSRKMTGGISGSNFAFVVVGVVSFS
jgi:hypothetical protein